MYWEYVDSGLYFVANYKLNEYIYIYIYRFITVVGDIGRNPVWYRFPNVQTFQKDSPDGKTISQMESNMFVHIDLLKFHIFSDIVYIYIYIAGPGGSHTAWPSQWAPRHFHGGTAQIRSGRLHVAHKSNAGSEHARYTEDINTGIKLIYCTCQWERISARSTWFMLTTLLPINADRICLDQKPPDEAANVGAMHCLNLLLNGFCSPSSC